MSPWEISTFARGDLGSNFRRPMIVRMRIVQSTNRAGETGVKRRRLILLASLTVRGEKGKIGLPWAVGDSTRLKLIAPTGECVTLFEACTWNQNQHGLKIR
jgi:hypothetical protein